MNGDTRAPRRLPGGQIRDICVGLFGVQIVWGLQNVNTSRIFQTLGADIAQLPILWIAAPITGLLVQPVVGHLSDHWRGRWGRRKPFIAAGAGLTAAAMLVMSSASTLTQAVVALWLLTAAVNIVMQPFRAMIADQLPAAQRATGFAAQVVFIGAGAVIASAMPWMLNHWFGVSGARGRDGLPPSVQLAFRLGAAALLLSVGWTLWRGRDSAAPAKGIDPPSECHARTPPGRLSGGVPWIVIGGMIALAAGVLDLRREIYLVAAIAVAYGVTTSMVHRRWRRRQAATGLLEIVSDIMTMPDAMRHLAVTQFLTWFALFAMWVYSVPAIALRHFGAISAADPAYNISADWVGVLFALYDGVAAAAALMLPLLVRRVGLRFSHAAGLAIAALGVAGFLLVGSAGQLWMPAVAIGIGWASILSAPYAIVANIVPPAKFGVFMGIHNMFLVLPQLVAAACLGAVVDKWLGGHPDAMLAVASCALLLAALSAALIPPAAEGRQRTMQGFA